MAKKSFLDSIDVASPCSKDWDEMIGDERVRFCTACAKNVYNLSAMPRREARKFAARNGGKVCVRYVRLAGGKLQTADTKLYQISRRAATVAAGVFGATLMLSAVADAQKKPPTPKSVVVKTDTSSTKNNIEESRISFTICDANDAVIVETEVVLTNQETNQEFRALTNGEGVAEFSRIPSGRYSVKASANGFQASTLELQIREAVEPNVKITLQVAVMGEIVTVDYEFPAFWAIAQENNEEFKKLVNAGFDVNTKDSLGETALHLAVEHGNLEIVRLLLERGADVNAKNKNGLTPIWGINDDDTTAMEIFRLLIRSGADVNVSNEDGETLLMQASAADSVEGVQMLLKAGADPHLKDKDGVTALMKTGSEAIKTLLRQYGARQ